jgi:hypothetical protein
MNVRLTREGLLIALVLVSLLAGCGGGAGTAATVHSSFPRRSGSLVYTVATTKARYAHGEPVPITFSVKNVGALRFDGVLGPCDWFDTQVLRAGQAVWQRSIGQGCAAVALLVSIPSGETKSYTYAWLQIDQQGNPVPSGRYTLASWYQVTSDAGPNLVPGEQQANEFALPLDIMVE